MNNETTRPTAQPAPATERDFLAWWTSIETDTRKSLIVGARRDTERLHALLRMAYEAAQATQADPQPQYTCERHADEVKKGGACVWCQLERAQPEDETVFHCGPPIATYTPPKLDQDWDQPQAPASTVKVERGRVWIVSGNQSFMLAHEADTDGELNWYANQLRTALSIITPCVKSVGQKEAGKEAARMTDTARLDWLEKHCTGASDSERYLPFRIYWGNKGATKGIRAVIDRAANTDKGEQKP
jgi:hypothetical protein